MHVPSGTLSGASVTARSLLEVADLVSHSAINPGHAGDDRDSPAPRLYVSNTGASSHLSKGQHLCIEARP